MTAELSARPGIVLLEEEGLFLDLLQRFPARRFPVFFAASVGEAAEALEAAPQLLIVPVGERPASDLLDLLQLAERAGTQILGLCAAGARVDPALGQRIDVLADPQQLDQTLQAAADLLDERRARPRAQIAVPVTVQDLGELTATVVSSRSLFVPTEAPLASGRMVQISLESSGGILHCWASVLRVGPGESGEPGMVLGVPERERPVRAYLDGLVRGALLLEHVEQAGDVPEGAGQQLNAHVQRDVGLLRDTLQRQMALTDALNDRLDGLATANARAVKWADVKPLLAKKLTTQQQQIQSLLERVDDLSTNRAVAGELRDALQTQERLEHQLHEQQHVIEGLRQQIDQLRAGQSGGSGPQSTVNGLSQIIHHLLARVEHLESAATAKGAGDYGDQVAQLSQRIDGLRDQLRLQSLEPNEIAELQDNLDRGQRELKRQLDAMDRGEWVPAPQLPDLGLPVDEEPTVPGTVVDVDAGHLEHQAAPAVARHERVDSNLAGALTPSETTKPPLPMQNLAASGAPAGVTGPLPSTSESAVIRISAAEALAEIEQQATGELEETAARAHAPTDSPASSRFRTAPTAETSTSGAAPALRPIESCADQIEPPEDQHELDELLLPARKPPWTLIIAGICLMMVLGALCAYLLLIRGADEAGPDPALVAPASAGDETASAEAAPIRGQRPADHAGVVGDADGGTEEATDSGPAAAEEAAAGAAEADAGHTPEPDAASAAAPDSTPTPRVLTAAERRRLRYRALVGKARRALRAGRHPQARAAATEALKMRETHQLRALLAKSHDQRGESWAAVHHYSKASSKAPSRSKAKYLTRAAAIYVKLGKRKPACAALRRALAARPSHAAAKASLARHCGGK